MINSVLMLALLVGFEPTPSADNVRKPHPFAPSLPYLSKEEEAKLDGIIDRFMLYDIGQLAGEDGKRAKQEFDKLGPEASFALMRGLNKAAQIEHSCPVLVISKKLTTFFAATDDRELLQFARENIGAGVRKTRHTSTLSDLKLYATLRQNALARQPIKPKPVVSAVSEPSIASLYAAASQADESKIKPIIAQLGKRTEPAAGLALAKLANDPLPSDLRQLARSQLESWMQQQSATFVQEKIKDRDAEVRAAAIKAVPIKKLSLVDELILLLNDEQEIARLAARSSLMKMTGQDFGPKDESDPKARASAVEQWQTWWRAQPKK